MTTKFWHFTATWLCAITIVSRCGAQILDQKVSDPKLLFQFGNQAQNLFQAFCGIPTRFARSRQPKTANPVSQNSTYRPVFSVLPLTSVSLITGRTEDEFKARYVVRFGDYGFNFEKETNKLIYFNNSSVSRLDGKLTPRQNVVPDLDSANHISLLYLNAAGYDLKEFYHAQTEMISAGAGARPIEKYWHITYQRFYKDLPYSYHAISLDINPVSGGLISLRRTGAVETPAAVSLPKISRKEASMIAYNLLKTKGISNLRQTRLELRWNNWNAFWTNPKNPKWPLEFDPTPKLMWNFNYSVEDKPLRSKGTVELRIDATTGMVSGGWQSLLMCAGTQKVVVHPFTIAFDSPKSIECAELGKGKRVASVTNSQLLLYGVIDGLGQTPSTIKVFRPTHKLHVVTDTGIDIDVAYDHKQGLLKDINGNYRKVSPGMFRWICEMPGARRAKAKVDIFHTEHKTADTFLPCGR